MNARCGRRTLDGVGVRVLIHGRGGSGRHDPPTVPPTVLAATRAREERRGDGADVAGQLAAAFRRCGSGRWPRVRRTAGTTTRVGNLGY